MPVKKMSPVSLNHETHFQYLLEMAGADRWFRVETGGVELVPLEEIVTAYQLQYSVEKRNHL